MESGIVDFQWTTKFNFERHGILINNLDIIEFRA